MKDLRLFVFSAWNPNKYVIWNLGVTVDWSLSHWHVSTRRKKCRHASPQTRSYYYICFKNQDGKEVGPPPAKRLRPKATDIWSSQTEELKKKWTGKKAVVVFHERVRATSHANFTEKQPHRICFDGRIPTGIGPRTNRRNGGRWKSFSRKRAKLTSFCEIVSYYSR